MKGVGDIIATAYVLTTEDPHRLRKSRDAGLAIVLGRVPNGSISRSFVPDAICYFGETASISPAMARLNRPAVVSMRKPSPGLAR